MSTTDPDDPTEEFWSLFGAELDEYLTAIETILAASPVDPARVDELFRAFHSVKGGSAALALRCVETVAHAAEDVLHLVRAGRRTLDTGLVSALLEALDEMRRLQGTAMATRADQPVNAAIVAKLKSHLSDTPAATPSAAPSPAVTVPQPAPPPTATSPTPALTIGDADLEAMRDAALGLIGAIDAEDPTDAAAMLAEAADAADLSGIAGAARRLAVAGRWGWLDLVLRLRGAGTASGRTIGAFALSAALEMPFGDLLLEHAGTLKTTPDDPAVWLHASRLLAAMEIEAGVELADLVATHLLRGEDLPDTEALTDLCALIGISASSGMDIPHDEVTALRDAWFDATGLAPAIDAPSPPPGDHAHPWPAETLLRMAEEAASGHTLTLVLLDLETDPAAVDAVTERIRAERCLYNRSRLDLGGGMFEYIVAITGAPDAFAAVLAEMDPSHACLRSVRTTDAGAIPGREAGTAETTPSSVTLPSLPTAAPTAAALPVPSAAPRPADAMVRVPSAAIDGFMDLIGELRLGLTALSRVLGEDGAPQAAQPSRATREEFRRLDRAVRQLYDGAISLRVVPIGTLFTRLLRPIRDTAVLVGKEVALTTAGEDVQVDKAMIEMLVDPLTHIVRNSVDHGIEISGTASGNRQARDRVDPHPCPADRQPRHHRGGGRRSRHRRCPHPRQGGRQRPDRSGGSGIPVRCGRSQPDPAARLFHPRRGNGHLRPWRRHGHRAYRDQKTGRPSDHRQPAGRRHPHDHRIPGFGRHAARSDGGSRQPDHRHPRAVGTRGGGSAVRTHATGRPTADPVAARPLPAGARSRRPARPAGSLARPALHQQRHRRRRRRRRPDRSDDRPHGTCAAKSSSSACTR